MSPAAAAVVDAPPFMFLSRDAIHPSPLNPRKHFDQQKLEELAATMANDVGIIEPIVVRPGGVAGYQYEIVAGERRWRAAAIAGLTNVPAIVKDLTDAQVLEIMVIENDQREDINPLEEGDGFKRLMTFGFDIDKLAHRIGRSRKYIYDRVKLLDLVPIGRELLLKNRITAGHAILIARLDEEAQLLALDPHQGGTFTGEASLWSPIERDEDEKERRRQEREDPYLDMKARSVRELEAWIDEHVRFRVDAPVNAELFPDTVRAVEEAAKVIHITYDHHVRPEAKGDGEARIWGPRSWKRADGLYKSKPCDRSVTGVVVVGPSRGEAFQVCTHKECDVHWRAERKAREKAAAKPGTASSPTAYEKKRAEENRRWQEKQEKERQERAAYDKAATDIVAAAAAAMKTAKLDVVAALVGRRFMTHCTKKAAATIKGKTADDMLRVFALSEVIRVAGNSWDAHREMPELAKALGLDLKKLLKHVTTSAQPGQADAPATSAKRSKAATKKR